MFKFRRSRKQPPGAASNPALSDDDDDEPMTGRGTSFKRNLGSGGALPAYDGRRRQMPHDQGGHGKPRSSSVGHPPSLRNYASNTRNKQAAAHSRRGALPGGVASSKVSWASDACSDTDVTETWTTDFTASSPDDSGSSASSEGSAGAHIEEFSNASGEFTNDSGSGCSEHDEGSAATSESGSAGDSYSEESGILFSSADARQYRQVPTPYHRGPTKAKNALPAASKRYFTDEEASYSSVGEHVVVQNARGRRGRKPPPPPRRKGSTGTHDSESLAQTNATESNDTQQWPGNGLPSATKFGKGKKMLRDGLAKSTSSRGSKSSQSNPNTTAAVNANLHAMPLPPNRDNGQQGGSNNEPREMKLKPPSMKGMNSTALKSTNAKGSRHQRSRSNSSTGNQSASSTPLAGSGATVATAATTQSDGAGVPPRASSVPPEASNGEGGEANTEAAAMQQLAYLVVSLRSDLREAHAARDALEQKVDELHKAGAAGGANPYSDNNDVKQLEKENADLQADVDAFIDEQDEMKHEIAQLRQDKSSLNDMIARLKREASVERAKSADGGLRGSTTSASAMSHPYSVSTEQEELQEKVKELTDENRKLEREIQLLVGEKSRLVSTTDSRGCELEELHKSLKESELRVQEKERALKDVGARVEQFEGQLEELGKQLKESKMQTMLLEDDLKAKEDEIEKARGAGSAGTVEGNKLTLLRNRLDQVSKQRDEAQEKNAALDNVMLGLKRKVEEMLKERNASRAELEQLREDNARMEGELKAKSSESIAKEATDADTLLNLQKMITSLQETKDRLEGELEKRDASNKEDAVRIGELEDTIKNLEGQVAALQEAAKEESESKAAPTASQEGSPSELQQRIAELATEKEDLAHEMEAMESKLEELELTKSCLEEELEDVKNQNANAIRDLEEQVEEAREEQPGGPKREGSPHHEGSFQSHGNSFHTLESHQNQVNLDTIANLQKMIAGLEASKAELEEEMGEATDAIAMLEDDLDRKDAQVKELLIKLTMLQQQFSQVDKCKTALAERNAKLSSDNDDLNTQIKVLIIEKKVASEEIETLKTMKTIADEDQEEGLLRKEEMRQEVDRMEERLEDAEKVNGLKIKNLQKDMFALEEKNRQLEEDLDESSDAIAVLREALTELEEGKSKKDSKIKELKASLGEKETALRTVEATKDKLQGDHQVSVDTIATLQKMIASLESSKEDLVDELNQTQSQMLDLKEKVKKGESFAEVTELEDRLRRAEERNGVLEDRIKELSRVNHKMKDQVKDLGESLAKVSASQNHSLALVPSASSSSPSAKDLVSSNDPIASCDALISELKNQINSIVVARNAALEEVEYLKSDGASVAYSRASHDSDSHTTMPPPDKAIEKKPAGVESVEGDNTVPPASEQHDEATLKSEEEDEDDHKTRSSSPSYGNKSVAANTIMTPASRGSSLLEAAKKLCNQLDEKRSKGSDRSPTPPKNHEAQSASKPRASSREKPMDEEQVKDVDVDEDIDDNVSRKEVKEDAAPMESERPGEPQSPLPSDGKKGDDAQRRPSSRSKGGRFDIDQLTSIYFEKCGMSVSKFSDLSSESSSFKRRTSKGNGAKTVTKKVKICRNGVFMGTYEGDLNPEGQRHGFGVLLCDNGNSYEGEWKKDKRDGLGIARYSSGDVYDGQWVKGKRQGHGVMYIEAGDTYIGSWNNGLKHGAGTYHWADGEVDVSWYQEDRRVGEGVRWNASRSKAFRLIRGTKKEELSLDEAYVTAEKLGLNLEKFDAGVP